jgi:hypothetical protein
MLPRCNLTSLRTCKQFAHSANFDKERSNREAAVTMSPTAARHGRRGYARAKQRSPQRPSCSLSAQLVHRAAFESQRNHPIGSRFVKEDPVHLPINCGVRDPLASLPQQLASTACLEARSRRLTGRMYTGHLHSELQQCMRARRRFD